MYPKYFTQNVERMLQKSSYDFKQPTKQFWLPLLEVLRFPSFVRSTTDPYLYCKCVLRSVVGGEKSEFGPGEEDYVMFADEVIMAAELQGDTGVSVEVFQVSQQCMTMVAEEALEIGPHLSSCLVNETSTAVQEGKDTKTVNHNFFLTVVPFVQDFPGVRSVHHRPLLKQSATEI
jgi:hypothetical protein